jgi:hypothetical protein
MAPMKPTGMPMMATDRGPLAQIISIRWNNAVGEL